MSPTSLRLFSLQAEKRYVAGTDCLSDIIFRAIERKRCEHISRLGCIGEQQALLATSPDA